MRKGDRAHHDDAKTYREQGQPYAWVQPFKEHVTWNLRKTLRSPSSLTWKGVGYFEERVREIEDRQAQ